METHWEKDGLSSAKLQGCFSTQGWVCSTFTTRNSVISIKEMVRVHGKCRTATRPTWLQWMCTCRGREAGSHTICSPPCDQECVCDTTGCERGGGWEKKPLDPSSSCEAIPGKEAISELTLIRFISTEGLRPTHEAEILHFLGNVAFGKGDSSTDTQKISINPFFPGSFPCP